GDLSGLHDGDTAAETAGPTLLPELKVNPEDQGANYLLTLAAVADPNRQVAMLRDALPRYKESFELPLRLARGLIAVGAFSEAEAYQRVPQTARLFVRAQAALARTLLAQSGTGLSVENLRRAAEVVAALPLEGVEAHRLRAEVLDGALGLLRTNGVAANSGLS